MEVTVLFVRHEYGVNIEAFEKYDDALRALYEWVKEYWWPVDASDESLPIPNDYQKAIDMYFEDNPMNENYELEEVEVQRA